MPGILGGLIGSLVKQIKILQWSEGTLATSLTHTNAIYSPLSNGNFFAFGGATTSTTTSTTSYNYSLNGKNWLTGSFPNSLPSRASAHNGSRIVVTFQSTALSLYSDNGTTWTSSDLGTSYVPVEGLWDGSRFIILGFSTSGLRHSTDGVTWGGFSGIGIGQSIAFNGVDRYIAAGAFGLVRTNTSDPTVSENWISIPGGSRNWTSVTYNDGIWLISGGGTVDYFTSANGTTWTLRTLPAAMTGTGTAVRPKMAVFDKKFHYVNSLTGTTRIFSSENGIDWTETQIINGLPVVQGWAVGPSTLVGVGLVTNTNGSNKSILGELP
jgi:hypothetical protein